MDEVLKALLSQGASQGFSTLLLFAGIYWMNKQNQRAEAGRQKERADRHADLNNRIVALEGAVRACEEDRIKLRDTMLAHFSGIVLGKHE